MSEELYDFVGYDSAQTTEEAIEIFEQKSGIQLYPGDERLMLINSFAYLVEIVMAEINYRANNNIIKYCDEETLYMKAADRCVERDPAEKAKVSMKFSTNTARDSDIVISKGTRVTADGVKFFATVEESRIVAGQREVIIECEAIEGAEAYNGLQIGEITILADTVPLITAVTNTTVSCGGKDMQDLEEFRKRVINAPKGYSTAGADLAYIEEAKKADSCVADAYPVYDDELATTNIYILCLDGQIPSEDILSGIEAFLSQPAIKPSADKIAVKAAVEKKYSIAVTYKIEEDNKNRQSEIDENIRAAVNEYVTKLMSAMGQTINPEILKGKIYTAGAASVTLSGMTLTKLEKYEVAKCSSISVTYGGTL